VVEARRKEEDRLVAGCFDDPAHVRRDQRASCQDAEVDRLQVGEQRVVTLDGHDGLPRRDVVAVVERPDLELVPAVDPRAPAAAREVAPRALPQGGDGFVHAAQHGRLVLLKDLHEHVRVLVAGLQDALGEVEVGIGVVALAHALDRQREDVGLEAAALTHGRKCTTRPAGDHAPRTGPGRP
jgi:hypothetical protein